MSEGFSRVYDYEGPPRVHHHPMERDILPADYQIPPVPESEQLDVVVSGGSMSGLFTAYSLQQAGHDVDVYEKTSRGDMKARGGGITPDGELLEYMEAHELIDRQNEVAFTVDARHYLDRDGSVLLDRESERWVASWDAFYRALREKVGFENYHMGREVDEIEHDEDSAWIRFEDGQTASGDLAVVAEGYSSSTREQLLPDTSLQYAGYVTWRGLLPASDLPDDVAEYLRDTFVLFHGPDHKAITYPVPGADGSTARDDRRINFLWYWNVPEGDELDAVLRDNEGVQRDGSLPPGALRKDVYERQLRVAEEQLPPQFGQYLDALTHDGLYLQCIYDLKVPRMQFGRACVLGDAAFFLRPHIGAGTSKGAADGITLAKAISTHDDLEAALTEWEATQLELGSDLVDLARERGDRFVNRESE